jgi:hypothetical protein
MIMIFFPARFAVFVTLSPYPGPKSVKVGSAAAWFTALVSAEMSAPEDELELPDDDDPALCGLELELEVLDEQPARASPPTTSTGTTFRRRNLALRTFSPSRIHLYGHVCSLLSRAKGCTCTACARSKIILPRDNVNSMVTEFAYRFGHYCQTSSGYHGKLSPQHIASSRWSNANSKTANIHGLYARYK